MPPAHRLRQGLVWGPLAGLLGAIVLATQLLWFSPSQWGDDLWTSVGSALLAAFLWQSIAVLLCLPLAGGRGGFRPTVPGLALTVAVLPGALSWVAFGANRGQWDLSVVLQLLLVLVACLVVGHAVGRALSERGLGTSGSGWRVGLTALTLAVIGAVFEPKISPAEPFPPTPPRDEQPEPSGGPPADPLNLLLVTVDTLRADHLGAYGYPRATSPHLDELAVQGLLVEHALAASSGTVPSVVTLLTGLEPDCHGAVDQRGMLAHAASTLAELLSARGFATWAVVANPLLTAESGFSQGFEKFATLGNQRAERVTDAALAAATIDTPQFGWVHYMDPHTPYSPPEATYTAFRGDAKFDPTVLKTIDYGSFGGIKLSRTLGPDAWSGPEPIQAGEIVARYDGEIRATDDAIGRLLSSLVYPARDSWVVAVAADHGETLHRAPDAPVFQHALDVYDSTVRVPMLLWAPRQIDPGTRIPFSRHQDLMPTLLGLLGFPVDPERNLLDPGYKPTGITQTAWWDDLSLRFRAPIDRSPARALVDGDWKLIRRLPRDFSPALDPRNLLGAWYESVSGLLRGSALYRLDEDPSERRNVLEEHPEIAQRMAHSLEEELARVQRPECAFPKERRDQSPELERDLRSLGYIN